VELGDVVQPSGLQKAARVPSPNKGSRWLPQDELTYWLVFAARTVSSKSKLSFQKDNADAREISIENFIVMRVGGLAQ
jgi:hypothetical protein